MIYIHCTINTSCNKNILRSNNMHGGGGGGGGGGGVGGDGGGGGGGGGGYIYSANTLPALWVVPLASCTSGLVPNSTGTYTATVKVVHGGGSGVMELVPWDSSMWWLYI